MNHVLWHTRASAHLEAEVVVVKVAVVNDHAVQLLAILHTQVQRRWSGARMTTPQPKPSCALHALHLPVHTPLPRTSMMILYTSSAMRGDGWSFFGLTWLYISFILQACAMWHAHDAAS